MSQVTKGWNEEPSPEGLPSVTLGKGGKYLRLVRALASKSSLVGGSDDIDGPIGVLIGFSFYSQYALREVARIERNLYSLDKEDSKYIPFDVDSYIRNIKNGLKLNQKFLDSVVLHIVEALVDPYLEYQNMCEFQGIDKIHEIRSIPDKETDVYFGPDDVMESLRDLLVATAYELDHTHLCQMMTSTKSTLRQFVRDWSVTGVPEREKAYGPILENLIEYMAPVAEDGTIRRVLSPGSGLGRLPFEILLRGYVSQGNEFNQYMLLASDWILNSFIEKNSYEVQPFCVLTNNRMKREDMFFPVPIPDVGPGETIMRTVSNIDPEVEYVNSKQCRFSMIGGEFVECYDADVDEWDAVCTSFFIDTAQNVIQYIKTFARIVKEDGLWINCGPLLYHYTESDTVPSIEIAWDDLKKIISNWFTILKEESSTANYTADLNAMMSTQYKVISFVAKRNSEPDPLPVSDKISPVAETCLF